ncbi:hypothetical protein, partial [Phascolarctobacterium faecium]|uniref:hypothetical protein n=1 Tax=Phascolarctobacterium faecium TaxID=33025 RepID=UPI003AB8B9B8
MTTITSTNHIHHQKVSEFYHIKNLQSTKTKKGKDWEEELFYHIKNLQSTKTAASPFPDKVGFITLRI